MPGSLKTAVYRMHWYGNDYFRLRSGEWFCLHWKTGQDRGLSFQESAFFSQPAQAEVREYCEHYYQQRLQLLPQLRVHWQPVSNALKTVFTDEDLLRLDSLSDFTDSYRKAADDFPALP